VSEYLNNTILFSKSIEAVIFFSGLTSSLSNLENVIG